MTDELLFSDLNTIDRMNVPYCIINNTLLSIYRDNKVFDHPNRELVVLMDVKDRDTALWHPKRWLLNYTESGNGVINLREKICINFYEERDGKLYLNPWNDNFFVYDRAVILPHKSMSYKGREIPIPNDTEKYLSLYYGDWKTPIPSDRWNWLISPFIVKASSIDEIIRHGNGIPGHKKL